MQPTAVPDKGWYYSKAVPGSRGFAIEAHPDAVNGGGHLFFTVYQYDQTGADTWQFAILAPDPDQVPTSDAGAARRYLGNLNQAKRTPDGNSTTTTLGSMKLSVSPPAIQSGASAPPPDVSPVQVTWPDQVGGRSVSLDRFAFDGKSVVPAADASVPQSGWWWSTTMPGQGLMVEVQGQNAFIGFFTYRADGSAMWTAASAAMGPDGASFDGNLVEYNGGATFTTSGSGTITTIPRGTISLRFSSPTTGTMAFGNNPPVPISRFSSY